MQLRLRLLHRRAAANREWQTDKTADIEKKKKTSEWEKRYIMPSFDKTDFSHAFIAASKS